MERPEAYRSHQGDAGRCPADVEVDFGARARQLAEFYSEEMMQGGGEVHSLAAARRALHIAAYDDNQLREEEALGLAAAHSEALSGAGVLPSEEDGEESIVAPLAEPAPVAVSRHYGEWCDEEKAPFVPKASGLRLMMVSTQRRGGHP